VPLAPVDVIGSAEDLNAFVDCSVDFVIANHGRGVGTRC
jgi:hypothetical protein